jgi:hypothetical protein
MSQNVNGLRLEDLEIKPHLITRLKGAGLESIFDLAIPIPHQLIEDGSTWLNLYLRWIPIILRLKSFLKKRRNIVGVIAGVVGAFLVYFGLTANVFSGVLTLLGVTGLTAMAAFLLNVVNTAANFFSKKQQKKPRLLLYFKNPKSSSLYEMRLLLNRNDRRQGIRKDDNLQMHRMRVNK